MRAKCLMFAIPVFLCTNSAWAVTALQGMGSQTCAAFAKDYASDPQIWETAYFTWAQGFMSGMNIIAMHKDGSSRNIGPETVSSTEAAIRSYCDAHPLLWYWQAVYSVYEDLSLNAPVTH